MTKQAAMYYLDIDTSYLVGMPMNQWISKTQTIAYPASNSIDWTYTVSAGIYGDYMTITKNGTSMVNVTDSDYGWFSVAEGDVVVITVHSSSGQSDGENATLGVYGNNLNYFNSVNGYNQSVAKTITWSPKMHELSVYGYVQTSSYTAVYQNVAISMDKIKNNCSSGYSGSIITYTVPANTYTASSQSDADNMAIDDANMNSQAYANANGSCTLNDVSTGCYNSFIVTYNPDLALGSGVYVMMGIHDTVGMYRMDIVGSHSIGVHDGDSIFIKIHFPAYTPKLLGVNILGQAVWKHPPVLSLTGGAVAGAAGTGTLFIAASTLTGGVVLAATVLVQGLMNLLTYTPNYDLNTTSYAPNHDPYDIWMKEKYACDQGNIRFIITNLMK